jgi:hypothetical protein
MANNGLPLLIGAAAVMLLMGKKGGGDSGNGGNGDGGDGGDGGGNGDDTGNGTDDVPDGGGGGGQIKGLAGGAATQNVIRTVNFSELNIGDGLGSKSAPIEFLPSKVGDTLEVVGWPAGTYSVLAAGGEYIKATDVIKASAVGNRLLVTLISGTAAPGEFDVRFRGGAQAWGGLNKMRYVYFTGMQ